LVAALLPMPSPCPRGGLGRGHTYRFRHAPDQVRQALLASRSTRFGALRATSPSPSPRTRRGDQKVILALGLSTRSFIFRHGNNTRELAINDFFPYALHRIRRFLDICGRSVDLFKHVTFGHQMKGQPGFVWIQRGRNSSALQSPDEIGNLLRHLPYVTPIYTPYLRIQGGAPYKQAVKMPVSAKRFTKLEPLATSNGCTLLAGDTDVVHI
jgi:hypothetical protein